MKIAICSQTGQKVDQCFGHAKKFYIYNVTHDALSFSGMRLVDPYFENEDTTSEFNHGRFAQVYETIVDCSKVYCISIDQKIAEKLLSLNIEVRLCNMNLKEIFHELITMEAYHNGKTRFSHLCM